MIPAFRGVARINEIEIVRYNTVASSREMGMAKAMELGREAATAAVTDKNPVYKTVTRELRTLQHVVESPSTRWNVLKDGVLGRGKIIEKMK